MPCQHGNKHNENSAASLVFIMPYEQHVGPSDIENRDVNGINQHIKVHIK